MSTPRAAAERSAPGGTSPSTFGASMAARRPHQSTTTKSSTPSDLPTFSDLGVPSALVRGLAAAGVDRPLPIQAATLPAALAGRDGLARGRTGSGNTYAFV